MRSSELEGHDDLARHLADVVGFTSAPLLWHYTSGAGLNGILENKTLRFGDLRFMNDARELKYAEDLARSVLGLLSLQHTAWNEHQMAFLQRAGASLVIHQARVHIFCLSERHDDLSQWRAYCPTSGYSIGFEPRRLRALLVADGWRLAKCTYDADLHRNQIEQLFRERLAAIGDEPADPETLRAAYGAFLELATEMKDPAFASEAEWRIISPPIYEDGDTRLKILSRGSMLVPHLEVPIDLLKFDWGSVPRSDALIWPIHKVLVGPGPHQDLSTQAAQMLMNRIGFFHTFPLVQRSNIPYRTSY